MNQTNLELTLKALRLSGLAATLPARLQEAAANRLSHGEFLELILQDELNVRQQRQLARRTQAADFHGLKPLEDFDWSFNPSIPKKDIFDLATCNFIRQTKDVLFLGPPVATEPPLLAVWVSVSSSLRPPQLICQSTTPANQNKRLLMSQSEYPV
jgi:DNA replication protein DnaC